MLDPPPPLSFFVHPSNPVGSFPDPNLLITFLQEVARCSVLIRRFSKLLLFLSFSRSSIHRWRIENDCICGISSLTGQNIPPPSVGSEEITGHFPSISASRSPPPHLIWRCRNMFPVRGQFPPLSVPWSNPFPNTLPVAAFCLFQHCFPLFLNVKLVFKWEGDGPERDHVR